jgi:hypothetical protein
MDMSASQTSVLGLDANSSPFIRLVEKAIKAGFERALKSEYDLIDKIHSFSPI